MGCAEDANQLSGSTFKAGNTYNEACRGVCETTVGVEKLVLSHILSVSVALDIHYAIRMRHISFCGLYGSSTFFHITS